MAITEVKTVKPAGGGDYSSLNAWEVAERGNLVTADKVKVAECYAGGNLITGAFSILSANWTSDDTRYPELRAAAGDAHKGIWDTAKAYLDSSAFGAVSCFETDTKHCRIRMLQFRTNVNATRCVYFYGGLSIGGAAWGYVDRCFIRNEAASPTAALAFRGGGAGTAFNVLKNSVLIANGTAATQYALELIVAAVTGKIYVYNNTLISRNNGANCMSISCGAGWVSCTTQNNYLSGGTCYGGTGTYSKGANDATVNAEAVTVGLRNVPYDGTQFKSVIVNAEDLHILDASTLKSAGADLSGLAAPYTVSEDFEGDPRLASNPFEIGADEYVGGGGGGIPASGTTLYFFFGRRGSMMRGIRGGAITRGRSS